MRISFYIQSATSLALSGLVVLTLSLPRTAQPKPGHMFSWDKSSQLSTRFGTDRLKRSFVLQQVSASEVSELLWSGSISLQNQSPETVCNVELAAQAVDFTVIRPNQIFSFNGIVGVRSEDKGYEPGLMYAQGEVITGTGGGICIASTLLYKAALETGMKLIERHPHSGPVSYAQPGMDAAVAYGSADLAFKNNTGSPIVIRATVDNGELVVALYGTRNSGRTVEITTEDCKEVPYKIIENEDPAVPEGEVRVDQKARPGYEITTIRLIKQDGKPVIREIVSHDVVSARDKVMRIPPRPAEEPLPPLPPIEALPALPPMTPITPPAPAPVERKPSAKPSIKPEQPEAPEVQPSPVPPAPADGGRSLPAMDRTTSAASE